MQARDWLERRQIGLYALALAVGGSAGAAWPTAAGLQAWITPALAVMLFATFLQVPLRALRDLAGRGRFLACLLCANFVLVPLLAAVAARFSPADDLVRLGVLLVLLTPCIDYVVTFAHLGRADARALLAATPVLLLAQVLLLPLYLGLLLDEPAHSLVQWAPFLDAFVWLIVVPLVLAGVVQGLSRRSARVAALESRLGLLPVPATAMVLCLVVASVVPQLDGLGALVLQLVPVYAAFALLAPLAGWAAARAFRLAAPQARAVCFSAGTRNSLVVLPIALAVPGAMPVLPAVIVTQTLVELLAELIYVRAIPRLPFRR